MTIDWTEPVELIETGERLTVLTTELPNRVCSVLAHCPRGHIYTYNKDGRDYCGSPIRVRNVREKMKRVVWLNVYEGHMWPHASEGCARAQASKDALAVAVPVEVEFYVGQGKE